jgi:hypothetical protein
MPPRFSLKTDLTLSVNAPSDRSFKYNNSANQSWLDRDKYRMKKWPHPVDRTTNWCAAWFTQAQSKEVLHWPREKSQVEDIIDAMLDRL